MLWVTVVLCVAAGCGGGRASSAGASSTSSAAASTGSSDETGSSAGALPENPSRVDVMNAMRAITPDIEACLGAYRGSQVYVSFTLSSSGTVTAAAVVPPDSPTAADGSPVSEVELDASTRACVEAAALGAHVPPFEQTTFRVGFPFRLR